MATWLRARERLSFVAESGEGLQEPRVGILGEEWLGTDEVMEYLRWRRGFYLKMIVHSLGVDRWFGVVVVKEERKEPRKG